MYQGHKTLHLRREMSLPLTFIRPFRDNPQSCPYIYIYTPYIYIYIYHIFIYHTHTHIYIYISHTYIYIYVYVSHIILQLCHPPRPVFRGETVAETPQPVSRPRSTRGNRPSSGRRRTSSNRSPHVLAGSQDGVELLVNLESLTMSEPAGLYVGGLPVGISVNSVRRLYETSSATSPTL